MKIIHCQLWGDIEVDDRALRIIDTWEFQRLHYIRQTGVAYKVFPTATSTRFAHSLGVYHLTQLFLDSIRKHQPAVYEQCHEIWHLLPLAGLCHDIGHGPFSHWFDRLCQEEWELEGEHEERGRRILRELLLRDPNPIFTEAEWGRFDRMLYPNPNTSGMDRHETTRRHWYETLICNPKSSWDLDKLDYLQRDVLQFGIRNGGLDISRMFLNCRVRGNEIVFCERIRADIENLFHLRSQMYQHIYRHPAVRRFEDELLGYCRRHPSILRSMKRILESKNDHVFYEFLTWTDTYVLDQILSVQERIEWETRQWQSSLKPSSTQQILPDEQANRAKQFIQFYRRSEFTDP